MILRSTGIIGGAQVANIGLGIIRTKALALMLGPSGVGIAGMYQAATGLVGTVTGFGVGSAGVRQIAEAAATGDDARVARTVATLRRVARLSGLLGMLAVLVLAVPLARATFGSSGYAWGVALMSLTLLFTGISAGQTALLQGLRRLRELAACNVLGATFGTVASIVLVYVLRERGIAPFLVAVSALGILTSWWYARRVHVADVTLSWRETWVEARPLLSMGSAFLVSGLCGAGVAWLTRAMVVRELGLDAVGLYSATWALSSVYVGVVLSAMGADFYPRLTAVASDPAAVNRLVNQQTEMGLLLAMPGLLATLVLAPWVLRIFYSADFVAATEVIRWQILGVGLRVVSWPMAFVQLALGRGRVYMATEAVSALFHVVLLYAGIRSLGLLGCGVSFFAAYVAFTAEMVLVCLWLTGFTWSRHALGLIALSIASGGAVMAALAADPWGMGRWLAGVVAIVAAFVDLRILKRKVGLDLTRVWQRVVNREGM
ncbi:MAG: O-antigen translocase [Acidobacteria bacterium]|nr:O-antigen translocase [Acidobacteriota bacterium]